MQIYYGSIMDITTGVAPLSAELKAYCYQRYQTIFTIISVKMILMIVCLSELLILSRSSQILFHRVA